MDFDSRDDTRPPLSEEQRRALFDVLNAENSLTRCIADAKRPNSAPAHDDNAFLERLDANLDQLVHDVLEASKAFRK